MGSRLPSLEKNVPGEAQSAPAAVVHKSGTQHPRRPLLREVLASVQVPASGHLDNRLLAHLPGEAFALLRPDLRQTIIPAGMIMLEAGRPIEKIYFPQTGLASLLVVTRDGGAIESSTIGREGAVGLHCGLGDRLSFTRAVAQIGGRFSVLRAARFAQIVQDFPDVRNLISNYTEVLWAETQQIAACNAVHDASSRLCRWLLQSADRVGSDQLTLTQEFLAQMLGVRRTTVTLLAQALQKKGVIKYSRGQISILERGALEACACECYHVIQDDRLPGSVGVRL
ncbi:MAG TPA: Crp/Fnr family transcriptional regulator [Pseudolabrys sp.]|nr:Crp/Fnr family transcriptional regulator [Pseudolabrys sp.]